MQNLKKKHHDDIKYKETWAQNWSLQDINNVIVTPCSVSSAMKQSPYTNGDLTHHENLRDSRASIYLCNVNWF